MIGDRRRIGMISTEVDLQPKLLASPRPALFSVQQPVLYEDGRLFLIQPALTPERYRRLSRNNQRKNSCGGEQVFTINRIDKFLRDCVVCQKACGRKEQNLRESQF
jgi:hypothetical protein